MQRTVSPTATAARHPFRQAVIKGRVKRARIRDESDIKLFMLSFVAFFICFYTFIF